MDSLNSKKFASIVAVSSLFLFVPVYKDFLVIKNRLFLISIESARAIVLLIVIAGVFCLFRLKRDDIFSTLMRIAFIAAFALDIAIIFSRPPEDLSGVFLSILLLFLGFLVPFKDRRFNITVLLVYSIALLAAVLFYKKIDSIAKFNIMAAVIGVYAIGAWMSLTQLRSSKTVEPSQLHEEKISVCYHELVQSKVNELPLTEREKEVACHMLLGESRSETADRMSISEETIKKHAAHIYEKMDVSSKSEFFDAVLGKDRER